MERYFVAVLMLFAVSCTLAPKDRANEGSGKRGMAFLHFSDDVIQEFYEQHREHLFVRGEEVQGRCLPDVGASTGSQRTSQDRRGFR